MLLFLKYIYSFVKDALWRLDCGDGQYQILLNCSEQSYTLQMKKIRYKEVAKKLKYLCANQNSSRTSEQKLMFLSHVYELDEISIEMGHEVIVSPFTMHIRISLHFGRKLRKRWQAKTKLLKCLMLSSWYTALLRGFCRGLGMVCESCRKTTRGWLQFRVGKRKQPSCLS